MGAEPQLKLQLEYGSKRSSLAISPCIQTSFHNPSSLKPPETPGTWPGLARTEQGERSQCAEHASRGASFSVASPGFRTHLAASASFRARARATARFALTTVMPVLLRPSQVQEGARAGVCVCVCVCAKVADAYLVLTILESTHIIRVW